MLDPFDLVLDAELFPFQLGEMHGVGHRPVDLFVDLDLETGVLRLQGLESFLDGHPHPPS
jgi:hypothetical protein